MENLERIKDFIWETDYFNEFLKSKKERTCLICGKKAREFETAKARRRYNATALCETCQHLNIE